MKKRILSLVLCFCMALGLLPTTAFAEDYTTQGGLDINGYTQNTEFEYQSNVLTIKGNGNYTISGASTADTIYVAPVSGGEVNITLNGVKIDATNNSMGYPAFAIAENTTVNLTLTGDNVLKSGYSYAGLQVPVLATLNITKESTGTLTATGGSDGTYSGAGIGGDSTAGGCGTVSIQGGNVNAVAGDSNSEAIGKGSSGGSGTLTGVEGKTLLGKPTVVTLAGVTTAGETVNNLCIQTGSGSAYAYGSTTSTLADGKLYLWLPDGATVTGATANDKQYSGSVASGTTGTLQEVPAVASVTPSGGTPASYTDFNSALTAAQGNTGSTLKLLADHAGSVTVSGGTFTLDLNGKTITGTKGKKEGEVDIPSQPGLILESNANVTLRATGGGQIVGGEGREEKTAAGSDGQPESVIVSATNGSTAVYVRNGCTFTVYGGTLKSGKRVESTFGPVEDNPYYSEVLATELGGTAVLYGGTYILDILNNANGPFRGDGSLPLFYRFYDSDNHMLTDTALSSLQPQNETVTVGELDWSSAITCDSGTKTYTVLSADGLRWISGVSNGTVKENTYQNDPTVPTSSFQGYTVKLGANIDLSGTDWTPIAIFQGTFDGAGHNVTNMTVNTTPQGGFISAVGGSATVKNLSISGSVTVTTGTNCLCAAGGIVGAAFNTANETVSLENCIANVTVSLSGTDTATSASAGGLVGYITENNNAVSIQNCYSGGTVTNTATGNEGSHTGVLVGYCELNTGNNVKLTNCYASQSGTLIESSTIGGYAPILTSVGTYDTSGNLTATNGTSLVYGSNLKNAVSYWVNRQGTESKNYVTWTADNIPLLTTTYAGVHTHTFGTWTKQPDGSYTACCTICGMSKPAEACLTSGATETPYATLEEAITAAQSVSSCTVKLLTDVTTDAEVDVASGTFTIDLNGKTWTGTPKGADGFALWLNGCNVTMKDSGTNGTFTSVAHSSASGDCATLYVDCGSVTIESGIYQITGAGDSDFAIYIDTSSENPIVTIRGGTFTSLKTNNGKTVAGLLADGYSYKNSGGTWATDINTGSLSDVSVQLAPVKITTQPQDVTVTYGYTESPALSVAAETVPVGSDKAITYQWYMDGGPLGGENKASITVLPSLAVGNHTYYCAVTCDGCTVSSKTVTVTVNRATDSITNKETGGYPTIQTYNGYSIQPPIDENFETNAESPLTYTWFDGQNADGSITGLTKLGSDAPANAGQYTLLVKAEESTNVTAAIMTLKVTIDKATPNIGSATYAGDTLYTSTILSSVTLSRTDTSVAGTLALDGVVALTEGTNTYSWKFTPIDVNNYETVTGTIELTVTKDELQSISVGSTMPSKTVYIYGDAFDKAGLTVTANYASGTSKDVTAQVTANALAVGGTAVTLSYTEDDVTKTCTVSGLTVNKKAGNNQTTSVSLNYTNTQAQTVDLSGFIPSDCGDISEIAVAETSDSKNIIASVNGGKSGKTASFTLANGLASGEQSATLTATIKTQNYADFTVTITVNTTSKTAVTITGVTAQNGTYNGGIHAGHTGTPSSSYTGTYEINYTGRNGTTYTGTTAPKNAGDYTVTFKVPDSDNTYAGSIDIPFTIGKATVVATADKKSITTGSTLPTFTVSYTGIVSGDTAESIFATRAAASCTADGKTAGSYDITVTAPVLTAEAAKNYTVGTSVKGTLTVITPTSGGSSSGSTTTNTVSVPVSSNFGKASVSASASVSGSTAIISVTDSQLSAIASTAKDIGTVKVDVSSLKVDAATVPSKVISAAHKAEGSTGLAVVLPAGTVTLDKTALAAVSNRGDVKVSVNTVSDSNLTDNQKAVLGNQANTAVVIDVNVYVNGTKTSTFNDGKIQVSVPYTLKSDEKAEHITVWFIKDDGTIEPKSGTYNAATGCVDFITDHLSQYLIVDFPFTDVTEDAWCYGSVAYAYNNGLFSGTSAGTFSPNTAMTRQMIWMVLARMDGKSPANMEEARVWAMKNGISDGSNSAASITREQMAAILYRYALYKKYDTTQGGMAIREFADYANVSEYALPSLAWAVNTGLVQGSGNYVIPSGNATRAQVAAILMRFNQKVAK